MCDSNGKHPRDRFTLFDALVLIGAVSAGLAFARIPASGWFARTGMGGLMLWSLVATVGIAGSFLVYVWRRGTPRAAGDVLLPMSAVAAVAFICVGMITADQEMLFVVFVGCSFPIPMLVVLALRDSRIRTRWTHWMGLMLSVPFVLVFLAFILLRLITLNIR